MLLVVAFLSKLQHLLLHLKQLLGKFLVLGRELTHQELLFLTGFWLDHRITLNELA